MTKFSTEALSTGMGVRYGVIDEGYAAFIEDGKLGELHRDVDRGWGWFVYIEGQSNKKAVFRSTLPQARNALESRAISTV